MEVFQCGSGLLVLGKTGQANIRHSGETEYEVIGWYTDKNGNERSGILSPEKWGFNANSLRGSYGAALAFVALHCGGVNIELPGGIQ